MDLKKVNLHPYVDYKISNVMSVKEKFGFRVTLYYSDGERKICQHAGYAKKTEASKARNGVIAQLHTGTYVVYPNIKVRELLVYWLEQIMRPEPSFTANSYHTYKNCIDKHIILQIGNLKLMTLNQGHPSKLYKSLTEKYTSIPKLTCCAR